MASQKAMKLFSVLSLLAFGAVVTVASPAVQQLERRAGQPQMCGDPRIAVPLLRSYKGWGTDYNHFYTADAAELQRFVINEGYLDEGYSGLIFPKQQPNTVPFFRLYSATLRNHFYTTSQTEKTQFLANGYVDQGTVGWVYPNGSSCGGLPLYRVYSTSGTDHFYTTSPAERASTLVDHVDQGIAAYIFPWGFWSTDGR